MKLRSGGFGRAVTWFESRPGSRRHRTSFNSCIPAEPSLLSLRDSVSIRRSTLHWASADRISLVRTKRRKFGRAYLRLGYNDLDTTMSDRHQAHTWVSGVVRIVAGVPPIEDSAVRADDEPRDLQPDARGGPTGAVATRHVDDGVDPVRRGPRGRAGVSDGILGVRQVLNGGVAQPLLPAEDVFSLLSRQAVTVPGEVVPLPFSYIFRLELGPKLGSGGPSL